MDKLNKLHPNFSEDELGLILWKLESIENFFPCYKTMIKKE